MIDATSLVSNNRRAAPRRVTKWATVSLGCFVIACTLSPLRADPSRADDDSLSVMPLSELTNRQDIRPGDPIEVTATLTCYDRGRTYCFVQDGEVTNFVDFEGEWPELPDLRAGDLVRIRGKLSDNPNTIHASQFEIIGHGNVPKSVNEKLTEMWLGKHWGRWIEHEGTVVHASCVRGATYLGLIYDKLYFVARIARPLQTSDVKQLLGAKVRLSGTLACDNQTGKLERFIIYVMSRDHIEVVREGDSWDEPPLSKLERLQSNPSHQRVRFEAAIGHAHPYHWLLVEDGLESAKVTASLTNYLFPGQRCEIHARQLGPREYEAFLIVAGVGQALHPPARLSAAEFLTEKQPLLRVEMDGDVVGIDSQGSKRRIQLQDNGVRFYVDFHASDDELDALHLESAERVRCVGCAEWLTDAAGTPRFAIRASSASDVTVEDRLIRISRRGWLAAIGLATSTLLLGGLSLVAMRYQVKQRTKQLSLLNARLAASYEAIQEGVMLTDPEGKVVRSNRRLAEIFDIDAPARGMPAQIAAHMATPREFSDWYHHAAKSATICQTCNFSTNSKPPRHLVAYTAPVRDNGGGDVTARIWTFEDITERKTLENQLQQSQKMEVMGMLAGGIAHNFNNLLTAISMNLQVLQINKEEKVEDQLESLSMALDATRRASTVVSQLLGFSRNHTLNTRVIHPRELISRVRQFLRPLVPRQISILTNVRSDVDNICVDEAQLEQVLLNLCVNARDAIGESGTIRIEAFNCEHPMGMVGIRISDNGCGISTDHQSKVFDPFFSTKGPSKGTGLGLSISANLIQQHGGTISVQSREGEGSAFTIHLPSAQEPTQHLPPAADDFDAHASDLRLLLVDDEEAVRLSTGMGLRHLGFDVVEAGDGIEMLQILDEDEDFAAVILDMSMPRMSGIETLRRLRVEYPDLPVVLYSGHIDRVAISHLDDPPDCVLTKPFGLPEMQQAIRAAVASRRGQRVT